MEKYELIYLTNEILSFQIDLQEPYEACKVFSKLRTTNSMTSIPHAVGNNMYRPLYQKEHKKVYEWIRFHVPCLTPRSLKDMNSFGEFKKVHPRIKSPQAWPLWRLYDSRPDSRKCL